MAFRGQLVDGWGNRGDGHSTFRQATSRTGGIGRKESCPSGKRCPCHLVLPSDWRPPWAPLIVIRSHASLVVTLLGTPGCVFDSGALSLGERCRRLYSARGGKSRSSANVPAVFGWGTYGDRRLLRAVLLKPTTVVAVLRQPCRGESALRIRGMMWFDEF